MSYLLVALLVLAPGARPTRHIVQVDGHPMAVWEKRPAHPRGAILLLHGRTWSSVPDFDLQVPGEHLSVMDALVARGYDVFALDARGYGATPRDSSGWLTPTRAAHDALAVLHWIAQRTPGAARPVLFGWSRGSAVAHFAAQLDPDAMSALILFGFSRPVFADSSPSVPPRLRNTATAAAEDFITPGTISKRALDTYVAAAIAADPIHVDWRQENDFAKLDPAAIRMPTLMLVADGDPRYAKHRAEQMQWFDSLGTSDKTLVVLPHADHAALLESAAPRFVQAIVSFIERPIAPLSGRVSAHRPAFRQVLGLGPHPR